jgi:hypothetical protein
MKSLLIALTIFSFAQVVSAASGELDGLRFCRSVETGGMFGQPKGTRLHCLSFNEGVATDNASTFFGNPPRSYSYKVKRNKIIDTDAKKATGYVITEDGNLSDTEGTRILVLQD